MASPTAQQAERAKIEQIVLNFFSKSLHIILESRIPFTCSQIHSGGDESTGSLASSSSSSGATTKDRWFSLALGDCATASESFESWRKSGLESMIVDVLLVEHKREGDHIPAAVGSSSREQTYSESLPSRVDTPVFRGSEGEGCSPFQGVESGIVLERWKVQYERIKKSVIGTGPGFKGTGGSKGVSLGEAKRGSTDGVGHGEALGTASNTGGSGSGLTIQGDSRAAVSQEKGETGKAAPKGGPPSQLPTQVIEIPAVYKRTVIMLRSLYCRARLLPAHRLFRLANSSSHSPSFSLSCRVLPSPPLLSEYDEMEMTLHNFTPIETPYGRMSLSVAYRHTTAITALEVSPPTPPHIILDYVGSPTTDPLKRFSTADPHHVHYGGISGRRGVHLVSLPSSVPSSPSGPSFARRHSWSGGVNKMQPTLQPQSSPSFRVSRSPSPSYPFDISPSLPHPPSTCLPTFSKHMKSDHSPSRSCSPLHPSLDHPSGMKAPNVNEKGEFSQPINIGRRWSPPFSPSPSPSPPTSCPQDDNAYIGRFRSGSAPVSIPKPFFNHSPKLPTMDIRQPSKSPLPPPSPKSRRFEALPRALSANPRLLTGQAPVADEPPLSGKVGPRLSTSSESTIRISTLHEFQQGSMKTNVGTFPRVENFLYGSLHMAPSRGSSKASGHEDADDEEFSCPFAVDADEAEDQRCRIESLRLRGRASESSDSTGQGGIAHQRSQDAAVGVLVRILKSARPLRQPFNSLGTTLDVPSTSLRTLKSQAVGGSPPNLHSRMSSGNLGTSPVQPYSGAPSPYPTKTTADALEELRGYKDMRDLLLSQSGGRSDRGGQLIGRSGDSR